MKLLLSESIQEHLKVVASLVELEGIFREAADTVAAKLAAGGTLYAFGNGGSAADAQHLVAELIGRFLYDREPIAAVALPTDSSSITCIGNDYSFSEVFSRPVRALVKKDDVVIGFSTSGSSANVLAGLRQAKANGAYTVMFSSTQADPLIADAVLQVESSDTARIQEAHVLLLHALCTVIEQSVSAA